MQASQLSYLRYLAAERRLETNTGAGPVFVSAPASFGLYGNANSVSDVNQYLSASPFADLAAGRALNGAAETSDRLSGLCSAAFLWPFDVSGSEFALDFWLPVDDFRDPGDFADLTAQPSATFEQANLDFWRQKLDGSGVQAASMSRTATNGTPTARPCGRSASSTASRDRPRRPPLSSSTKAGTSSEPKLLGV